MVLVINQPIEITRDKIVSIHHELDFNYTDYEIVIINQEPLRNNISNHHLNSILNDIPSIRYIQLASFVHADIAWAAGLENAIGDFVVLWDPEHDPVEVISDIVELCRGGYDVVVGVGTSFQSLLYKSLRKVANVILSAIDYHLPQNATGLRCLSRRAVNAVTSVSRFHHQIYLRIQKTGYPWCIYKYKTIESRLAKKTVFTGLQYLVRLMVFNSSRPLRWMSALGLFGSFTAFVFAAYSLLVHFVNGNVVEGWTTTILFMSMLFMLQFIMMAFFGEYMGRLLDERKEQADYSVVFERNSQTMVNQDRVNVMTESISQEVSAVQTGRNK